MGGLCNTKIMALLTATPETFAALPTVLRYRNIPLEAMSRLQWVRLILAISPRTSVESARILGNSLQYYYEGDNTLLRRATDSVYWEIALMLENGPDYWQELIRTGRESDSHRYTSDHRLAERTERPRSKDLLPETLIRATDEDRELRQEIRRERRRKLKVYKDDWVNELAYWGE